MTTGEARTGVEIQGLYDGVCVWVYPDGSVVNRFTGTEWEGTRRWREIELYIENNLAGLTALAPRATPTARGMDEDG